MILSRVFTLFVLLLLPFHHSRGQEHAAAFEYLIDAHPGTIDNAMKDSGYQFVRTNKDHGNSIQYWWNADENKCISIEVDHSRVIAVLHMPDGDCYQKADGSLNDAAQTGYTSGVGNYAELDVAYDRGYTDGLRNRSFKNNYFTAELQKSSYNEGYGLGMKLREQGEQNSLALMTTYRSLEGLSNQKAGSLLEKDGFQEVISRQLGGNSYCTWYNTNTGQCINMIMRSGYVNEILISAHCRE